MRHNQVLRAPSRRFLRFVNNLLANELDEENLKKSTVVFSPHPDDETLGCGGTIIRKKRMATDVTVVFMTDGRRSHRHLISEDELRLIRKKEALEATCILGMREDDNIFLDFRNGELAENRISAASIVADILEDKKPKEIFIPYCKEPLLWGSGEHLATNAIVVSALKTLGRNFAINEYPIGFWCNWPWAEEFGPTLLERMGGLRDSFFSNLSLLRDFRHFVCVDEVLEIKRAALNQYRSQMTRIVPDPRWQTMGDVSNGKFLQCFFQKREIFLRYIL